MSHETDSKTAQLTILRPGPCATLQDLGRSDAQSLGFCQSGAMDEHAFLWANTLLSNNPKSACLEITLGPFSCEFNATTKIALTGAAPSFYLNEKRMPSWQTQWVNAGDIVRFDMPRSGLRSYLAVAGGFKYNAVFNSAAMVTREKSGPYGGDAFAKGQTLFFPIKDDVKQSNTVCPWHYIPKYEKQITINMIPAKQYISVKNTNVCRLLQSEYIISPDSNRMGYRLSGHALSLNRDTLFSHGVPFGAVQVPPDGQPIILLKDRQTIGGYPIIGYINQLDCFRLSQSRPGDVVRFTEGNLPKSSAQLSEFYRFFFATNRS